MLLNYVTEFFLFYCIIFFFIKPSLAVQPCSTLTLANSNDRCLRNSVSGFRCSNRRLFYCTDQSCSEQSATESKTHCPTSLKQRMSWNLRSRQSPEFLLQSYSSSRLTLTFFRTAAGTETIKPATSIGCSTATRSRQAQSGVPKTTQQRWQDVKFVIENWSTHFSLHWQRCTQLQRPSAVRLQLDRDKPQVAYRR